MASTRTAAACPCSAAASGPEPAEHHDPGGRRIQSPPATSMATRAACCRMSGTATHSQKAPAPSGPRAQSIGDRSPPAPTRARSSDWSRPRRCRSRRTSPRSIKRVMSALPQRSSATPPAALITRCAVNVTASDVPRGRKRTATDWPTTAISKTRPARTVRNPESVIARTASLTGGDMRWRCTSHQGRAWRRNPPDRREQGRATARW